MKKITALVITVFTAQVLFSQSAYDHKAAFNPQFYPFPGNEYRSGSGEPGPKYWQNKADYNITASLDTLGHVVTGLVDLFYTNNSPDNLKLLWLQIDQNIYKEDSRSNVVNQSSGRFGSADFTSGSEIKSVTIEADGKKYQAKYKIVDTRMQIWLETPLKAMGGKLKITMPFQFTIPKKGTDRMGRLETKNGWVYEIAQWFPRMCVYDDIQGWNVLPYIGQGEFYLEYGDITFNITAPSNLFVVGSGELLNPQECLTPKQLKLYNEAKQSEKTVIIRSVEDITGTALKPAKATNTWKFKMQNTRDVAWGASRAFIIDGSKINLPSGKNCMAMSAYPVESARDKEQKDWQKSTEMVKSSIEFYSKTYFEYPYPAAVNVAGIVAGMEYPGIVFCSYRSADRGLWGVTDHEFGHTWFPMIVGSNERKYAWMDEGFNTFINEFSTNNYYNKGEVFKAEAAQELGKMLFSDKADGLYNTPEVIQSFGLGQAAYFKPSVMLLVLRNVVLDADRFDAAFKEYIKRWAFKHPTPWDFFHTIENISGEDLGWFWRGWVLNNWKVDIAVKEVKSGSPNAVITIENLEKMPMPTTLLIKESNGKEYKKQLPVEIWQRGATYKFTVPSTTEITEVVIDPDHEIPDVNPKNNVWKANAAPPK